MVPTPTSSRMTPRIGGATAAVYGQWIDKCWTGLIVCAQDTCQWLTGNMQPVPSMNDASFVLDILSK
jgi:hypothetical protein